MARDAPRLAHSQPKEALATIQRNSRNPDPFPSLPLPLTHPRVSPSVTGPSLPRHQDTGMVAPQTRNSTPSPGLDLGLLLLLTSRHPDSPDGELGMFDNYVAPFRRLLTISGAALASSKRSCPKATVHTDPAIKRNAQPRKTKNADPFLALGSDGRVEGKHVSNNSPYPYVIKRGSHAL